MISKNTKNPGLIILNQNNSSNLNKKRKTNNKLLNLKVKFDFPYPDKTTKTNFPVMFLSHQINNNHLFLNQITSAIKRNFTQQANKNKN